ncbi:sensor histidine kinase [Vacuolonema iberomarrocanum]|uniref:sensor histidine kinase n=1 Tax=Vacuolonema iberomarrocanum TaxID=3454632 RepID=UPI0019F10DDF|nr:sensor histidine kinase [filamentous cyanobacterium LEGE 07170]
MHSPHSALPRPERFEASPNGIGPESVLSDLPLYQLAIAPTRLGYELAQIFQHHPDLPGVILQDNGDTLGIISRQRFLEFLLRPQGTELFLTQSLWMLHTYARYPALRLPASTSILNAARQALRRSPDQRQEPILVEQSDGTLCLLNIHEIYLADWQIRGLQTQVRYERMQLQMIQHEKMAALGRLVDGVTHEILDPVGFIWGNVAHLSEYCNQVMELLATYQAHWDEKPEAIVRMEETLELDYLTQDIPHILQSIQSGANRLKTLAVSLQNFCHIDEVYPKPADLHGCLDSLLLLLEHHLTGRIRIVRQYEPIPPIPCFVGQLSQVFINLLTRSVETLLNPALKAQWQPIASTTADAQPCITVKTRLESSNPRAGEPSNQRWVVITIADDGLGLSPEEYAQIRHSFSVKQRTTQETSLALSYQIVTAKHGGSLVLRSPTTPASTAPASPARGTAFEVWLPLS